MTERELLATLDPQEVLQHLIGQPSWRKLRLAAVACCRQMQYLLIDERSTRAVDTAECYADKSHGDADLVEIEHQAIRVVDHSRDLGTDPENTAAHCAALCLARWAPADWGTLQVFRWSSQFVARSVQVAILACVFAVPYRNRRIHIEVDPAWRTSDVLALARGIYGDRAFDRMPILADALQEAGCDSADILDHLRDPNATHVRGCWALDLVLGKE
jgi:hypothetical protein